MGSLARAYGRPLALTLTAILVLWILALILVPLGAMVQQSLWWKDSAGDLSLTIDRLYNDIATLQLDAGNATDAAKKAALDAEIATKQGEATALEAQELNPGKQWGLDNFTRMSSLHLYIFVRTILYALMVTALALIVCYPVAYVVALASGPRKAIILTVALIVPYAINELLRVYAWLMILDYRGVINGVLGWFGVVDLDNRGWIPFLENPSAVFLAMIYTYVLFMVFPIVNTLETLDRNQIEAARDLGASTARIHRRVIIPHAKPGIAVGCIMTFMLSAGSYSVPAIMTRGQGGDWFSQLVYRQFFESNNWNMGSAYAVSLLVVCTAFILLMMRFFGVGLRDIAK
ncbi:ABC transporter permease [Ancylobacter amanitiformis]|uniref:Spermidine/putrescine transport system permease protein n=1 Tax=Ancylobacter amanitiformis TaxID=217069 RepID=A0ABU0LXE0_9HYPH|nr:ABC transporter permease [Ancylobacter amanitiformis]MDQ0513348.1 spermidine/putrescine transport system permease protein [Ancylobacter amanitiformis]